MKTITFTTDFTAIANSGDAQDVQQTANNLMSETQAMIERLYPDAEVIVNEAQHVGARCFAIGFEDDNSVEERVLDHYGQNEFTDSWV